jgi:hypothetical protein
LDWYLTLRQIWSVLEQESDEADGSAHWLPEHWFPTVGFSLIT